MNSIFFQNGQFPKNTLYGTFKKKKLKLDKKKKKQLLRYRIISKVKKKQQHKLKTSESAKSADSSLIPSYGSKTVICIQVPKTKISKITKGICQSAKL